MILKKKIYKKEAKKKRENLYYYVQVFSAFIFHVGMNVD